jgi:hypothetical protein
MVSLLDSQFTLPPSQALLGLLPMLEKSKYESVVFEEMNKQKMWSKWCFLFRGIYLLFFYPKLF